MATFNENLARLRKAANLTQEALAQAVGVSAQAVSKWENNGVPDATLLPAIADALSYAMEAVDQYGDAIYNVLLDGLDAEQVIEKLALEE